MRFRTRLTLGSAGILFASTLLILSLAYFWQNSGRIRHWDDDDFEELVQNIFGYGVPIAGISLAGGWWLMKRFLRPVILLTEAAEKIHEGNLHTRLPLHGSGDELDRLTEVFNQMIGRLEQSFQRIREFTLHASHELKTPLSVLQGDLETELHEKDLPPLRREQILNRMDEILRLAKIVDGLTLLTRADAGLIQLSREDVRLDELVRESYEDLKILGRSREIDAQLLECSEWLLKGDRHRLRQLLLNLTDNAVKYNERKGRVVVALRKRGEGVELEIANTGEGIPPEKLNRVFERFYRGDESHSHEREGCGLGLSISQWIVHAHGGTLEIFSKPEDWTRVVVRFQVNS